MLLLNEKSRVVIWGCGHRGKEFIEKYRYVYDIEYCVDSKVEVDSKENTFYGYNIFNPKQLLKNNKELTIIITMDKWQEIAHDLVNCGYKMLRDFYPFTYIDMDNDIAILDMEFLEYIDSDSEKVQLIRKLANGRKVCTTYGLCHMTIYKRILSEIDEFRKKYILLDLPAINAFGIKNYEALKEKAVWNVSDVLICGIMDKSINIKGDFPSVSELNNMVRTDCRIIRISGGAFKGFFPQHTENNNTKTDENGVSFRRYVAWGDKNINRLYAHGKSLQEIKEKILSDNFYEKEQFLKFFENEIKILGKVESNCDVKIADFIKEISKSKITHYSFTHPIPEVMLELTRRLLVSLEIDVNLDYLINEDFLKLDCNEEIVYPSVLKALGLDNEYNMKRKVKPGHILFDDGKLSSEEYIEKYIEYVCK
jgi:hypothetical protein